MENNIVRDDIELPMVDLLMERSESSKVIVKACEEFGFFKVINHGVKQEIIWAMEEEARKFFSKPVSEKQRVGPADPYGYGCRNIGLNGDVGEVEYLLLQANPLFISNNTNYISASPHDFRYEVSRYVEAMRELACEILDLIVEGLWATAQPNSIVSVSGLLRDIHNDSLIRLNHYPPGPGPGPAQGSLKLGFGAHTDPQMLTILRSNGCAGLQISLQSKSGVWVPTLPPLFASMSVMSCRSGQAMTNGRFVSVKHRAVVNSMSSRMSIVYFAAPPLHATITCIDNSKSNDALYRTFSWAEYKKVVQAG